MSKHVGSLRRHTAGDVKPVLTRMSIKIAVKAYTVMRPPCKRDNQIRVLITAFYIKLIIFGAVKKFNILGFNNNPERSYCDVL